MKTLQCPVCRGTSLISSTVKCGVQYRSCGDCDILFADGIDPDIIRTHNDGPEARADEKAQSTRLQRIIQHLGGRKPEKMLDFGCGRGDYILFLKNVGIEALGIDQDTALQLPAIPLQSMDAVNMVEVIEHLGDPVGILQQLKNILKPGGIIYIESSFTDFIGDPAVSAYVDPRIGHCCIHSRRSIDYMRWKLRMRFSWINNNVVVLQKTEP